jgi:hypothetical protein
MSTYSSRFLEEMRGNTMQETPLQHTDEERDYEAGFARVMRFAEQASRRGWKLTDRQLVHEITQRERAAAIREKSSLPIIGTEVHSAAWNRGQADALRTLLRLQRTGKEM